MSRSVGDSTRSDARTGASATGLPASSTMAPSMTAAGRSRRTGSAVLVWNESFQSRHLPSLVATSVARSFRSRPSKLNRPSRPVIVDASAESSWPPAMITFAPGSGRPFSSTTCPVTGLSGSAASNGIAKSMTMRHGTTLLRMTNSLIFVP